MFRFYVCSNRFSLLQRDHKAEQRNTSYQTIVPAAIKYELVSGSQLAGKARDRPVHQSRKLQKNEIDCSGNVVNTAEGKTLKVKNQSKAAGKSMHVLNVRSCSPLRRNGIELPAVVWLAAQWHTEEGG